MARRRRRELLQPRKSVREELAETMAEYMIDRPAPTSAGEVEAIVAPPLPQETHHAWSTSGEAQRM